MVTLAPMHLLVVDDDRDSADALSLMLGHLGHDAQVATSAESALANCTSCTPDAMFIDLAMPSIDGISMAQLLRAMPAFAHTPLVAVSGYTDAKNQVMAIEAAWVQSSNPRRAVFLFSFIRGGTALKS